LFDTTGSEDHASTSFQAYKLAWLHASQHLVPTHQTRLGLALNFSIFYYDVLKSPERACHLAKFAFDEAVVYATNNPGQVGDDSLGVMQLLQDNMTFWLDKTR
jgi:14-3-3 protein epsilon